MTRIVACASALLLSALANPASAESAYAADVPESVTTPDVVDTYSLGTLEFFDGMPSPETVDKLYDTLDLIRGTTAFLDGIPVAAIQAFVNGFDEIGLGVNEVGMTETLMDARSIWLTANTTTIYVTSIVDTSEGPVVIEVPPGILALLDDAEFTYVADFGPLGPDEGKGGKYLLLPPHYEGDVPEGYFVVRSKTYYHWLLGRMSPDENGDTMASVNTVKQNMNIYPLSQADNPPEETFHNLSGLKHNTVHANNIEFFHEINQAVQREPEDAFNPELLGKFASVGIRKGEPFELDERMTRILTEAASIANGVARAITYAGRDPEIYFYEDRQWNSPFQRQSYQFLVDGARVLDDRTYFHYMATGITPAMTAPPVGSGSVYAMTARDINGDYLDGSKTYKVDLPGPVPAANFWSFMMYSGQTRSMLETDQKFPGMDSNRDGIRANDDGGFSVYVGPKAPEGWENNWVQTMPGKSFNMMFRLYGPLEPWFDKTWKPSDFVPVE
ncbi:DUF1254 domain-containing protein [Tropicimonas sp. TH_r6]|uniref:DUF1254 domain-containing protein n=1 Tax=Tropicimonas sp. TH_r6 TaxID=3082085 RepID=UPI0029548717|nr:DUF1254 domain-containing protein [Tropicimonas sp. TH_r6]MDV7145815.1 DUF1254 domain-containing protein [Tropicimonas sp. TH_r6]